MERFLPFVLEKDGGLQTPDYGSTKILKIGFSELLPNLKRYKPLYHGGVKLLVHLKRV